LEAARPFTPDRNVVTLAALIARDQTVELPYYLALALDNGVKPAEVSEIITHLTFYTGWANAMHAIPALGAFSRAATLEPISSRPLRVRNFRSTRSRKSSGRRAGAPRNA
jgi:hypothetical protein